MNDWSMHTMHSTSMNDSQSSTTQSLNLGNMRTHKTSFHKSSTTSWMQSRNDASEFETTSLDNSSTPTKSSPLLLTYWVGARTRIPLYVRRTFVKTVDMVDTGLLSVQTGGAQPVRPGDQGILKKTAPITFPHRDEASAECVLYQLVVPPPDHPQHDQFLLHIANLLLIGLPLHWDTSLTVTLSKKIEWSSPLNPSTTPLPPTPFLLPIPLPSIDPELSLKQPLLNHPPSPTSVLCKQPPLARN